jgi:hypothetical protein
MMNSFKPLNLIAILSTAIMANYVQGKLSADPAYRLFNRDRDCAGTKPHSGADQATTVGASRQLLQVQALENEPVSSEQAQSDRPPSRPRRRAF